MASIPNTTLLTRSDFIAQIRAFMGSVSVSDEQIIQALNVTLSAWGDKAKTAYCYDAAWSGCSCTQALPCCGIDDADIFFKDCNGCEYQLNDYDIRKGVVHLKQPIGYASTGANVRVIAYATPAPQPVKALSLSRAFTTGVDTDMYLDADLSYIPFGGWVQVCGAWYQYRCWERIEVTPDRITVSDANGGTLVANIDPSEKRSVDSCGVVTVLKLVQAHCANRVATTHAIGSVVELGITTSSAGGLDFLIARTLSEMFVMLAMSCTSDDKASFFLQMANRQDARAKGAAGRHLQGRKPRVSSTAFVNRNQHGGGYYDKYLRHYI